VRTDAADHEQTQSDQAAPIGGAVRTVSGLTLISRFAGLARDIVLVRVFGDTGVGSAFAAAFAIPNTFRRLFGEGALSAAFIPEYARALRQDKDVAARFASLTVALLTLVTGALALVLAAVLAVILLVSEGDDRRLSIGLIIAMLPFMPLICVAATLGGMLQVHARFAPQAAQPIILNALIIAAASAYFLIDGLSPQRTAYMVAGAAVASGAAQVLWALIALRPFTRWSRNFGGVRSNVTRMLRKYLPALLGLGTLQVNTLIDTFIAMWPIWIGATVLGVTYPLGEASAGILFFSQRLYQFPLGVFGVAVATAVFPLLSRQADEGAAFTDTLRRGLRLSLFIGLPASAGLLLVRTDLVTVTFSGGGGFSADGLARSAAVLAGYAPAVWAYSLNQTLTRAFYAKGDTKTPVIISMRMVALNIILSILLIWPLAEAGLAWATATTATIQCLWLSHRARALIDAPLIDADTRAATLRILIATIIMSACVWAAQLFVASLPNHAPESWTWSLIRLAAAVTTGGAAYTAIALLTRSPELRGLIKH
jgi:putative peptidoglycan lipid II flippase